MLVFASESAEETSEWVTAMTVTMPTMKLGNSFGLEARKFVLNVRNRRMKITDQEDKSAVFEGNIWKLKSAGDPLKDADWFQRKYWVAKNGSLVYYSVRD